MAFGNASRYHCRKYGRILDFNHPEGTFPLTPASLVCMDAIAESGRMLSGTGIDWGSGCGCLSVMAAMNPAVEKVIGLELEQANVDIALENAKMNNAFAKTVFYRADGFSPFAETDKDVIDSYKGRIRFVVANPPSSTGDDGFSFRRKIVSDSREFLEKNGLLFLNISIQYGRKRIAGLSDGTGFSHKGVVKSTGWTDFDLSRTDLMDCLKEYVNEEQRGGYAYEFYNDTTAGFMSAQEAMQRYEESGKSPLSKWQTHLFVLN